MDPTKTRAHGHWSGACPKCGRRDGRQGAQVRKGGRMYVRASTRMYKRGMRTATRLTMPSLRVYYRDASIKRASGIMYRWAECDHPYHERHMDPLDSYRPWWCRPIGPDMATPATSVNIHSKDDSRRKAKSRREKAHQGKDRR